MKKILSLFIICAMTVCGMQAAFAAQTQDDAVAANTSLRYKTVTTLNIKQGSMLLYPYNLSSGTTDIYRLEDETTGINTTYAFKDFYNRPKSISISSTDTYKPLVGCGSGMGGGGTFEYGNTGGKYDVIKVKISDFISELNSNGSITRYNNVLERNVTYTFTEQVDANGDRFYSGLFFESGAAVTCATPDKNGEVEIVVSRNPGHHLTYSTSFGCRIVSLGGLTTSGGGGKNRGTVKGLIMGDVDLDGRVSISDVTCLQRILSEQESANALSNRNADIDRDNTLSVQDATVIQRHLADYDISQYYK